MTGSRNQDVTRLRPDGGNITERAFAVEAPIAIEYNGIGYAVMMMSPTDLDDFAAGFSLSERLIDAASDIEDVTATETDDGWVLRIQISPEKFEPVLKRARMRVSESSCGLCGLESLEQLSALLPPITSIPTATRPAIFSALATLEAHQPLSSATGAVHAAAFCSAAGEIEMVREDVGRHTAFDKLIGAMARAGRSAKDGFFLLTARCSYELVEKTIVSGCPLLVTISAPTTMALDRAAKHGLSLIALARPDAMLVASDPHGMFAL